MVDICRFQGSMQSIHTTKIPLILNQIYDILAALQAQGNKIIVCKIPAHIWIKEIEEPAEQTIL